VRTDVAGQPESLPAGAPATKPVRKFREGTKQEALITMLRQPLGANIAEIAREFEWAPHTVRATIAGALKKKLGLTVTSEKHETRGRIYRIVSEPAA
jgi:transposase-like protein